VFLPFVEKEFPHLLESYKKRYEDRAFLPKAYGQRLSQLVARLREKYGIRNSYERYSKKTHPVLAQPMQMELF
jgi:hypothetical protein